MENGVYFAPMKHRDLAIVMEKSLKNLYTKYEAEGRARKTIKAQELWFAILECAD